MGTTLSVVQFLRGSGDELQLPSLLTVYLFQKMYEHMKTFVCNESQEVLSIFDYQPSNMTARYKANRNGLQVVIQITPVPNSSRKAIYSDLNNLSLCQGFQEKDFLMPTDKS